MNGAKKYHSKFGTLETIKLRHILFPRSSWPLRFNSSDNHSPVSTQDFEFVTKWNSHQIMNLLKAGWVQSERMLDVVTRPNVPART